jgi:PAS domain S-box-containing protein
MESAFMNLKIRILHLEDSLNDSEIIQSEIQSGGIVFDYFLADNEQDFLKILETEKIDIIISDYSLPNYNGNEALKVAREKYSYMPFIFVSGAMGEDNAIKAMLNGATDYVLKNKLERLVPAIKRALHECELEVRQKQAEIALRESEERYSTIVNCSPNIIFIHKNGIIQYVNDLCRELLGYSKEESIGVSILDFVSEESKNAVISNIQQRAGGKNVPSYEININTKLGEKRIMLVQTTNINFYKEKAFLVVLTDVTELEEYHKNLVFQNEEKEKRAAELIIANKELAFQNDEKEKRAAELVIANLELVFQNEEKELRAAELIIANTELVFQNEEKEKRAAELIIANDELVFQNNEKEKRAEELIIANDELAFQNEEKEKRAAELIIANEELAYQNNEKEKRAEELIIANKELIFQNEEKEMRAAELIIANEELAFQNNEKEKRAAELVIANFELIFQNEEKEKRAAELVIANDELVFQNNEKEKRAAELIIANKELVFQNEEKEKRAAELIIADKELIFQTEEKEKRAAELIIADKELIFQTEEKEKRAAELIIADKELIFQTEEKEKRAEELIVANIELDFQTEEKEKRAAELIIADKELVFQTQEKEKRAAELIVADRELIFQTEEKEKRAEELIIANIELDFQNEEKVKRAEELIIANIELAFQNEEKEKRALELSIANKELEYQDELKERTKQLIVVNKELVEAKLEAEKANLAKSTFLANMSHEIRTPMNAVLGFSELLNDMITNPKAKNYLKAIQTSGKTLHNLINDILDFTKIEAGMFEINKENIDIKQVVLEIKYIFSIKMEEKSLDMLVDFSDNLPSQLYLDELRIKQVIINLVGNAIKFTDTGHIKICVSYLKENELIGTLVISVEDTGIGIPLEAHDKIFNVFQQQDMQDNRKYGGTGLGLSISSRLVSLMNGKILLESEPGIGSKFTVIINKVIKGSEEQIDTGIIQIEEEIEFYPATILIADDVESNRELIKGYLDEFPFNILEADNGLIAVSIAENVKPDLIFMDIRMPVMDGYDATEKIKANKDLSHIPIIVLSASYLESEKSLYLKNLISGYLIKPVSKDKLIKDLKKHLKYKKNIKQINNDISNGMNNITYHIENSVRELLSNELMKEWEALQKRKPQEKLKSFSKKLINIGKENNLIMIEEYGENLLNSANMFDIAGIITKLKEFPNLIKSYK